MTDRIRKLALTTHVVFSVGWIGAVIAYLSLVISILTDNEPMPTGSAWASMEVIGWFAIIPLAIGALISGLVMSIGTPWGLFRHYWVVAKLVLTTVATVILIVHMPTVSLQASGAPGMGHAGLGGPRGEFVHAGGGLLILLAVTMLAIYKPKGLTAYGKRRKQS